MKRTDEGSASEPMPFAIDLLAGVEVLLTIAASALLAMAALARKASGTTIPVMEDVYPRVFYEPEATAIALLAGPPLFVAVGLVLRKPWGRYAAVALHGGLGVCAVWHFALRLSSSPKSGMTPPELTVVMLFLFALSIGVPLFLSRRHMRAAFARGRR